MYNNIIDVLIRKLLKYIILSSINCYVNYIIFTWIIPIWSSIALAASVACEITVNIIVLCPSIVFVSIKSFDSLLKGRL